MSHDRPNDGNESNEIDHLRPEAEEKIAFLGRYDNPDVNNHFNARRANRWRRLTFIISLILNALFLLVSIGLGVALISGTRLASITGSKGRNLIDPYSPANAAIEYEYRSVVPDDDRFVGYPDAAWEENMQNLMAGTLIRFSQAEIDMDGSMSIQLKDGGYAGSIGVGHNLHCLKKMKQYLYPDYFYSGADPHSDEMLQVRDHVDHCVDWLRQAVMCHADPSMYTMRWFDNSTKPFHNLPTVQKCVNWDKLHNWMHSRAASQKMLVRE